MKYKKMIITLDVEADNQWDINADPKKTANADYIPRFQELCELHGFVPTYLLTYEMACNEKLVHYLKRKQLEGLCEVGMHLHSWMTPPIVKLPNEQKLNRPYLYEYDEEIMQQKITFLANYLSDCFEAPVTSHRAGRWGINEAYIKMLKDAGIFVDCSVTPGISWRENAGGTPGSRGQSFLGFPEIAYEVSKESLSKEGKSGVLEVPVTILHRPFFLREDTTREELHNMKEYLFKRNLIWLRPNGHNLPDLKYIVKERYESESDYIEFMIHSSELMPGGSPYFTTKESIENLYGQLESLFTMAESYYEGVAISKYALHSMEGKYQESYGVKR